MGIDLAKVAHKALETAIEDGKPRRRGGTVRAMAAGAVLAIGVRAVAAKAPRMSLDELRDIPDRLRDRITDAGWFDDEPDVEDESVPDEDDELDEDEELDDDFEDESDDDFEDEEEDEDEEADEPPDLELGSEDDEDVHPEDRPPKPPKAASRR